VRRMGIPPIFEDGVGLRVSEQTVSFSPLQEVKFFLFPLILQEQEYINIICTKLITVYNFLI
jgi:hypothetical protein